MKPTEHQVREIVVKYLQPRFAANNIDANKLDDRFDLLESGVIDSLGVVELISKVEQEIGLQLDFEAMDSEELTMIGPFCRFVSEAALQS